MTSKKRSIYESSGLAHDLAANKVLNFFNEAKDAKELVDAIRDDPTFGKSKGAYGIRSSVANNIIRTRAKLPGNKFTEIKQIDQIYGIGPDTLNDIFYSFYSDIIKNKIAYQTPQVILDFVHEHGLLYIVIENIGDLLATKVSIDFNKKIFGVNKEKNISEMRIFKNLSVIPPKKKFKIFVDTFNSYLKNKQPLVFTSKITYYDKKRRFDETIKHDLTIYKDLVEILNPTEE